ncbi:ribosome production factor 2 homolog [Halyomorpha halys]|uniref:ribosome production factor 2 homolog n=1 Tax=Halyomorpha halys TaxID=286706 RepID=UPI0034D1DD04
MQRIKKPTTHKGKKFILDREPKLIENKKESLFLYGRKGSEIVNNCLKDLYHLKKPDAIKLGEKNDFLPFESSSEIERLSKKYDASLIFFGSHNKKRPNNLILCRMYDHSILDMVELGIKNYRGISEFKTETITTGLKPCLVFSGPLFEQDSDLKRIQNMLVDFFQREDATNIRLQGLEHVLMFTATQDELLMRSYRIFLKKSGCKTPRVELEEHGPSIDFVIRRKKLGSEELFKLACKVPKELKAKKVKNVKTNVFGTKLGRVHVGKQNIGKLQTRKMKGLRKSATERRKMRANKEKRKRDGK